MRIGMVGYPTYGGSGVVAAELARELARRGHEVHFFAYEMPVRLGLEGPDVIFHPVEVLRYDLFKYPSYDLALAAKMYEIVLDQQIQILHAHYALPHAVMCWLVKLMAGSQAPRIVTTVHGTDVTLVGQDEAFQPVVRAGLLASDAVTAVSEYLRQRTLAYFGADLKVEVIPNFVDVPSLPSCPTIRQRFAAQGEAVLVHVSNFRALKRPDLVVRIFERIQREHPARLFMVGEGPEMAHVRHMVDQFQLRDKVVFFGNTPRVSEIYAAGDFMLQPSVEESFGLAVLEGMNFGCIPVASNIGGLPEVVENGQSGLLFAPDDWPAMAEGVLQTLADAEARQALAAGARRRARLFDRTQVVDRYEALYRRLTPTP